MSAGAYPGGVMPPPPPPSCRQVLAPKGRRREGRQRAPFLPVSRQKVWRDPPENHFWIRACSSVNLYFFFNSESSLFFDVIVPQVGDMNLCLRNAILVS